MSDEKMQALEEWRRKREFLDAYQKTLFLAEQEASSARDESQRNVGMKAMQRADQYLRIIRQALEAIPDKKSAYSIALKHISRSTWKEIAAAMGDTVIHVHELYNHGLDQLEIPAEAEAMMEEDVGKI